MSSDPTISGHVAELLSRYGDEAAAAAGERMREEMEKGDVKAAGIWFSVMYEITRAAATPPPSKKASGQ